MPRGESAQACRFRLCAAAAVKETYKKRENSTKLLLVDKAASGKPVVGTPGVLQICDLKLSGAGVRPIKVVRVKGSTLYVYRVVILLWTEYRLAAYDLANRKLLVDLLVNPEDMSPLPERR